MSHEKIRGYVIGQEALKGPMSNERNFSLILQSSFEDHKHIKELFEEKFAQLKAYKDSLVAESKKNGTPLNEDEWRSIIEVETHFQQVLTLLSERQKIYEDIFAIEEEKDQASVMGNMTDFTLARRELGLAWRDRNKKDFALYSEEVQNLRHQLLKLNERIRQFTSYILSITPAILQGSQLKPHSIHQH